MFENILNTLKVYAIRLNSSMFRKIPFDIPKINTQMDDVSTFENKKVVQKHKKSSENGIII